jgi:hypothetical protein
MPDYPLNPDPRASLIAGSNEFLDYQKKSTSLYLKKEVPELIRQHVSVVQRLLELSYFEYEFIDVAFTHAVFGLEKALKLRHEEIEGKEFKGSFENVTTWAFSKNLLENDSTALVDIYRQIRNSKVHAPTPSLMGIAVFDRIEEPVMVINDLYEDVTLRSDRKELMKNALPFFESFRDGAYWNKNDKTYYIRNVNPVFVNNKSSHVWYIAFIVATDLGSYTSSQMLFADHIVARDVIFDLNSQTLSGKDVTTGEPFRITKLDDLGIAFMKWWLNVIDETHKTANGNGAMPLEHIIGLSISLKVNRTYRLALSDFYAQD